jgi:hypothetical protein
MNIEGIIWSAVAVAAGIVVVWLIVNALGGQPVQKDDD